MSRTFTLLLVHAHPDDECSSTGGLILKSAREGHRVILVTCTNGEMGKMEHLGVNLDPDSVADQNRLGEIRIEELERAARILQVSEVHTLGYRDSGMDGWEGNGHPEAFKNADEDEVVGKLVGYMRRYRPDVVVTYNEQGGYGHPDHVMANKVTTKALEAAADLARFPAEGREAWRVPKFYHTAWSRSKMLRAWRWMKLFRQKTPLDDPDFREDKYGTPDEIITTRVNIRWQLRRKWRALTAHKSQINGNFFWWFVRLTGRWLYNEETFVSAQSQVKVREGERSVFEGLP
jgi:LmbE family N-acetylglucosaminyl deacetylase